MPWHLNKPPSLKPFPPRTWTRGIWKWYYRQSRICARESAKAFTDAVCFGAGFTRIDANGIEHVPYNEVMRDAD
jgi:hypothetical protein